jgi:Rho family protein
VEELQEGCPEAKMILVALKCDLRDDEVALKKIKPVSYEEVCVIVYQRYHTYGDV